MGLEKVGLKVIFKLTFTLLFSSSSSIAIPQVQRWAGENSIAMRLA